MSRFGLSLKKERYKEVISEIENKKKYDKGVIKEYKLNDENRFMPALYEFYLFSERVKDADITTNDQLLSFLEENGHFLFGGNGHFNLTKRVPMTFKTKGFDIIIPFNNHKLFYMLFYSKDNIATILANNSWAVGMAAGSPIKGIQSSAPKIKELFKRLSEIESIPKKNKWSIKIKNQLLKQVNGERLIDIIENSNYHDKIDFTIGETDTELGINYKSRDDPNQKPSPFVSQEKSGSIRLGNVVGHPSAKVFIDFLNSKSKKSPDEKKTLRNRLKKLIPSKIRNLFKRTFKRKSFNTFDKI
jgi:hypothetical protein